MRAGWLDTYRGLATIFMVTVHYLWAFAPASWHIGLWVPIDLWAGSALSLFSYAAGASASMSCKRFRETLLSSLMLMVLGLVFHQMWYGWILPLNPTGILVVVGASRIVVSATRRLNNGSRLWLAAFLIAAYFVTGESSYLVYIGFALIGSVRPHPTWIGPLLIVAGYVTAMNLNIPFIRFPVSLSYLYLSLGIALSLDTVSQRIGSRVLSVLGLHSIEAYITHQALQVWALYALGASIYEARTLAYVTLICLAWYLVYQRVCKSRETVDRIKEPSSPVHVGWEIGP